MSDEPENINDEELPELPDDIVPEKDAPAPNDEMAKLQSLMEADARAYAEMGHDPTDAKLPTIANPTDVAPDQPLPTSDIANTDIPPTDAKLPTIANPTDVAPDQPLPTSDIANTDTSPTDVKLPTIANPTDVAPDQPLPESDMPNMGVPPTDDELVEMGLRPKPQNIQKPPEIKQVPIEQMSTPSDDKRWLRAGDTATTSHSGGGDGFAADGGRSDNGGGSDKSQGEITDALNHIGELLSQLLAATQDMAKDISTMAEDGNSSKFS